MAGRKFHPKEEKYIKDLSGKFSSQQIAEGLKELGFKRDATAIDNYCRRRGLQIFREEKFLKCFTDDHKQFLQSEVGRLNRTNLYSAFKEKFGVQMSYSVFSRSCKELDLARATNETKLLREPVRIFVSQKAQKLEAQMFGGTA